MLTPASAAPPPRGQGKLESPVDSCERQWRTIGDRHGYGSGLSGHCRFEDRIAADRVGLPAGRLSQDERPGRIALSPGQVKATQARGAAWPDERPDDANCLAGQDG